MSLEKTLNVLQDRVTSCLSNLNGKIITSEVRQEAVSRCQSAVMAAVAECNLPTLCVMVSAAPENVMRVRVFTKPPLDDVTFDIEF
jgi:hypothetical protein